MTADAPDQRLEVLGQRPHEDLTRSSCGKHFGQLLHATIDRRIGLLEGTVKHTLEHPPHMRPSTPRSLCEADQPQRLHRRLELSNTIAGDPDLIQFYASHLWHYLLLR